MTTSGVGRLAPLSARRSTRDLDRRDQKIWRRANAERYAGQPVIDPKAFFADERLLGGDWTFNATLRTWFPATNLRRGRNGILGVVRGVLKKRFVSRCALRRRDLNSRLRARLRGAR